LQSHRRFQDLNARGYDLRTIPGYRFESVVEEPAKRYGVAVEKALVDAVIGDAPTEGALPLLAFALQRLWRQYAASGTLTSGSYDKVGGLRGLIQDAAERALRGLTPDEDVALLAGARFVHLQALGNPPRFDTDGICSNDPVSSAPLRNSAARDFSVSTVAGAPIAPR
jgi:hypothetical protein